MAARETILLFLQVVPHVEAPQELAAMVADWSGRGHILGRSLIWLASVMVLALLWRSVSRQTVTFRGWISSLGVFVVLCGIGPVLDFVASMRPAEQGSGYVDVVAGLGAWVAVWALYSLRLPRAWGDRRHSFERTIASIPGELDTALAQFHILSECIPQIVWTARADGFVDYYNRRWYEATGAPEGRGGDASWSPVLHPDDMARCRQAWYEAVSQGVPFQIEHRLRSRESGVYRWYLVRSLPLRDDAGRIVRWFGTATDIDDQKRAEEVLRQSEA
ncbi:PAS domain-containing protein, partial [Singulisphaera rosea]